MTVVTVHEAKTNLSRLLARVEAGEEVIVARADHPVARLVPFEPADRPPRPLGRLRGRARIGDQNWADAEVRALLEGVE
jgi:prevent-host-death family protein